VPKNRLITHLVPTLTKRLYEYNTGRADRLLLRAAIHAGEVLVDTHGYVGAPLNTVMRLVDSAQVRTARQLAGTDLVVALTEAIHEAVVDAGPSDIDASEYRRVMVEFKGQSIPAWIHMPSLHGPPPHEPPRIGWSGSDDLHHRSIFR
jgi:hypothetical protein